MNMRPLAALALAALLAAGCGPAVNYKYHIAVIPKGMTHQFWQSIHRGADRAAADFDKQGVPVEILWDGPKKESDSSEQINLIATKAAMGINGLVLAPQDSHQMVNPVQQVVDKHIPVVIIDSGLENQDLIVKYVATNNYHGGELAAQRLLEVLNQAGAKDQKIVLFRYAPGSESTEQREKGFHDAVDKAIKDRKPGDPAISWESDTEYAGATVETAQVTAGALLGRLKGKDGVGIFAVNESAAAGMLNQIKTLDLRQKFKFVGFDSSEQLLDGVRQGDIDGLIVQDPYRMGYLGVWTLVKHLEGYDVSEGGKDQYTGEYVVTRDNVDADETRRLFVPELQEKRTADELLRGTPKYKKKS